MNEAELAAITARKVEADRKLARLMRLREVLTALDDADDPVCEVLVNLGTLPGSLVQFKRFSTLHRPELDAFRCLNDEEGLKEAIHAALRTIVEGRIATAAAEFEAV